MVRNVRSSLFVPFVKGLVLDPGIMAKTVKLSIILPTRLSWLERAGTELWCKF